MNIVFIVVCHFPHGEASSVRAINLCHLLHDAGHNVHVISDYPSLSDSKECDFCTYESASQRQVSLIHRNTIVKNSLEALESYCSLHHVDAVLSNARFDRFEKLVAFCKKRKLKLYIENCEWYHCSSFKLKWFDLRYWKNEWMIRRGFRKADGFISISTLLNEHNLQFGVPSVRIPTIMDTVNIEADIERCPISNVLNISYTGNPGRSKEYLKPIIKVLATDDCLKSRIRFHIYGASRKQVEMNLFGDSESLLKAGDSVIIHGKVPQEKIGNIVKNMDFSIFLRPNRKSSNAGFPTKLGESMSVGTPVISNCTGDIGIYLKDGINGFLLKDFECESVRKVFYKILEMPDEAFINMRKAARKTAEESFDYKKYLDEINILFKG